jgi:cell division septal protein FtsQ
MEKNEKTQINKSIKLRARIVYFLVLGLFLLIIGGLIFASLQ